MRIQYMLLLFFFICTDSCAASLLLASHQNMRYRRELYKEFKNDSTAAFRGDAEAQYKYGLYCYLNSDVNQGMDFLNKSAKQNNPNAIGVVAEILYLRHDDYHQKEAYQMFKKASTLNDTLSICYLGICKYWGHGTQRNYHEAVNYFKIASTSKQTYVKKLGLYYLAKCYRYGRGIDKNVYVSNVILLDYDLNASMGQLALSNLSYAKNDRLIGLENLYTNAPLYLKLSNETTKATNLNKEAIEQVQSRYTNILNGNTDKKNDNQPTIWQNAQKAQIEAEKDAILEPLNFDDAMNDLELSTMQDRLKAIDSSWAELDSDEAEESKSVYYHLVSVDGTEIEACDKNRLIINEKGVEYCQYDNTVSVISFDSSQLQKELKLGHYLVSLSSRQKCEINVTFDTDFTYKVEIKQGQKINTYVISKKCYKFQPQPTFGLK